MKEVISGMYLSSNSDFTDCQNKENQIMVSDNEFSSKQMLGRSWNMEDYPISDAMEWDQHPFFDNHSRASLLPPLDKAATEYHYRGRRKKKYRIGSSI